MGSELLPPLSAVLLKLGEVALDKKCAKGDDVQQWLTSELSLRQLHLVYNSNLYAGYLKFRYDSQLALVKQDPTEREALLPLLLDSPLCSARDKAALRLAQVLGDEERSTRDRAFYLWSIPNCSAALQPWTGLCESWKGVAAFAEKQVRSDWVALTLADMTSALKALATSDCLEIEIPNLALRGLYAEYLQVEAAPVAEALMPVYEEQLYLRMGLAPPKPEVAVVFLLFHTNRFIALGGLYGNNCYVKVGRGRVTYSLGFATDCGICFAFLRADVFCVSGSQKTPPHLRFRLTLSSI